MEASHMERVSELYEQVHRAHVAYLNVWLDEVLWTWHWWLGLSLLMLPWIIWALLRKRDSTARLLHAAFVVVVLSSWFDFLGTIGGLWFYSREPIPTIPGYVLFDFSLHPVAVMSFLQVKPALSPWIKATAFGLVAAFLTEPVFRLLSMYHPVAWFHWWSFPIYVGVYLVADRVSRSKTYAPLQPHAPWSPPEPSA